MKKTILKKQSSKSITKVSKIDLFPVEDEVFDFSKDITLRVKERSNKLSDDITKWTNKNFVLYLKSKITNSVINVSAYEFKLIDKARDELTLSYQCVEKNKELQSDNVMLKNYFDWWIESNEGYYTARKLQITIRSITYEKFIHDFFNTSLWKGSKTNSGNAGATLVTKTSLTTPQNNWNDLYKAGGLNRLIYDAGVVDAFHYLLTEKNKTLEVATKELKTTLRSLHDAVFTHIIHKTLNKMPYSIEKKFDIENILPPIIKSKGMEMEFAINYNNLFKGE